MRYMSRKGQEAYIDIYLGVVNVSNPHPSYSGTVCLIWRTGKVMDVMQLVRF